MPPFCHPVLVRVFPDAGSWRGMAVDCCAFHNSFASTSEPSVLFWPATVPALHMVGIFIPLAVKTRGFMTESVAIYVGSGALANEPGMQVEHDLWIQVSEASSSLLTCLF